MEVPAVITATFPIDGTAIAGGALPPDGKVAEHAVNMEEWTILNLFMFILYLVNVLNLN